MDLTSLFDRVAMHLRAYGLRVDIRNVDFDLLDVASDTGVSVSLTRGNTRATYDGVVMSKPNYTALLHQARHHESRDLLLLTRYLNPRTAHTLQRAGIQYIDGAGNAMISFGDVYLRVEGRRPDAGNEERDGRPTTEATNLFSPRRAQVIMALVSWPELANESVRAIAECAGTSVGIAQSTTTLLRKMDLEPHRTPRDHERLIDMWVAAYPEGLGRTLAIGSFEGDPSPYSINYAETDLWVSGETLAPNLSGQGTLTLYVEHFNPRLVTDRRWRRSQSPNIFVRRKFWHRPEGRFEETLLTPPEAPPLMVYADMMAISDPRVRIAAEEFREGHRGLADPKRW